MRLAIFICPTSRPPSLRNSYSNELPPGGNDSAAATSAWQSICLIDDLPPMPPRVWARPPRSPRGQNRPEVALDTKSDDRFFSLTYCTRIQCSVHPRSISRHEVACVVRFSAAVQLEIGKRRVGVGDRFRHDLAQPSALPSSKARQVLTHACVPCEQAVRQ